MFGDEEDYHYEEAFPAKHNIKEIKKIGTKIEDKPTLKEDQEWETDEEDEEYDDDDEEEEEEGFSSIKSDLEDFKNWLSLNLWHYKKSSPAISFNKRFFALIFVFLQLSLIFSNYYSLIIIIFYSYLLLVRSIRTR